ncbi:hypothetical protein GCM10027446_12380 [Angustibacter peucedani]
MTFGRSGLVCGAVVLMAVAGCSGSSDDGADGSPSAGASATGTAAGSAAQSTSQTVPISGGTHVTDGAAQFDLPAGVAFVEAPPTVQDDAGQRTWRYAPDPSSALCVVTLVQQPDYTQPFPDNERQLLKTRVEQMEGGKVLVDDQGPGPDGTASGWLTHHTTPASAGVGRTQGVQVWSRSFLTQGKGLVQLSAAAREDQAQTCQVEAVVRSLGFTGSEVTAATPLPSTPGSTPSTSPTGSATPSSSAGQA